MVKYLLSILLILLVVTVVMMFSVHNDQIVTFNYLIGEHTYQLSSLLALSFMTGFLFCWLICSLFYLRLRIKHQSLKRQHKRLMQQTEKVTSDTDTTTALITPKPQD